VHQIDEFNIKKHNIFLHGSIPPNPRDRCVLPKVPAFPKKSCGKNWYCYPNAACYCGVYSFYLLHGISGFNRSWYTYSRACKSLFVFLIICSGPVCVKKNARFFLSQSSPGWGYVVTIHFLACPLLRP